MTLPVSLSITLNASAPAGTLPAGMRFVRVLHELELPVARRTNPPNMPEVRPLFPTHFSPFGRGWQMGSWSINTKLSASNMTAVYNTHLWITNRQGFGDAADPRANYFLMQDLDKPLPKVESLTCGGNLLHVTGEGNFKTNAGIVPCYTVEVLAYGGSVPTASSLNERPWLVTYAVDLRPDGTPSNFPQGQTQNGGVAPGVRHPLICHPIRYPQIYIEKWRVVEWNEPYPPDPLKVYLPI